MAEVPPAPDATTGAAGPGPDTAALPGQRGSGRPRASRPGPDRVVASPFTSVPRAVGFARRRPAVQVLLNLVLFTALPNVLFWQWFLVDVRPALVDGRAGLRWAMPLAALWITLGPLLMQLGEFISDRWMAAVSQQPRVGLNLAEAARRRQLFGRLYYRVVPVGALAALASLALALPALRQILPIEGFWAHVSAFLVVGQIGFVSTSGALGAFMAMTVPMAALRGATLSWSPYRSDELAGVGLAYRYLGLLGVMFSVGAIFVPSLLIVERDFAGPARVIIWLFIGVLLVGGAGMFLIPTTQLYLALSRAKAELLRAIDRPIDRLLSEVIRDDGRPDGPPCALSALLAARRDIEAVQLAPGGRVLINTTLTVVLPVASVLLPVVEAVWRS